LRPPYTVPFTSVQGLAAGDSFFCEMVPSIEGNIVRIDFVSFYWGAPSSVASNSCVVIPNRAVSGSPTCVSYDSGVTGSANPIYEYFQPKFSLPVVPPGDDAVALFVVTNTSFEASVDVCVSGIVLVGVSPTPITTVL